MSRWVDRTFGVALGASVVLHAGGVSAPVVYEWVTGRPAGFFWQSPPAPRKIPVEFVDAPEESPESKLEKETNRISSKQTVARDRVAQEKKGLLSGPAAKQIRETEQLAKKSQPDQMARTQQGTPEPKQEFMTPEDPLKRKETTEAKQEEIEKLKQRVAELEEMKMLLEKVKEKKLAEPKKQKKPTEALKLKETPPGNAPKTVAEQIFNPVRNLDSYNSEEVQKFLATAVNVGESSFDAKKHALGPYLKKLKSKISPMWRLKLESQTFGSLLTEKKVVIGFKILTSGRVAEIIILEDHGDDLFNKVCVQTVRDAAPFEPLPEGWMEQSGLDYLNLIYTFVVF